MNRRKQTQISYAMKSKSEMIRQLSRKKPDKKSDRRKDA